MPTASAPPPKRQLQTVHGVLGAAETTRLAECVCRNDWGTVTMRDVRRLAFARWLYTTKRMTDDV